MALPGSMDSGPHTPDDIESLNVTEPYPFEDLDAEPDSLENFDENSDSGSGIAKDPRSTGNHEHMWYLVCFLESHFLCFS